MQPDSPGIFKRDVPGECSEDCLFLNIYTPAPDNKARPVMVWIHGGAFVRGPQTNTTAQYLQCKGIIVVVTVNFRLGVFGFWALQTLGRSMPVRNQMAFAMSSSRSSGSGTT